MVLKLTCHICTEWQRMVLLPIDSSINKLTNYYNTTAKCWLFCFFWGMSDIHECLGIGCHWLACASSHFAENLHMTHWFSCILWHSECNRALIYAISPWKLLSVAVACHFVATHHSYISAYVVDKNYLKWHEIQLAVQSVVGSLIAITSFRFVANFKLAALIKPSLNITLWISELCISKYLSLCVNDRFFQSQTHIFIQ